VFELNCLLMHFFALAMCFSADLTFSLDVFTLLFLFVFFFNENFTEFSLTVECMYMPSTKVFM
jgi:hypothetical protein